MARIGPYVRETPLERSQVLSGLTGAEVLLKAENRQHTGSFKARGAFNKLLSLDPVLLRGGVVAASSGNHGAALAFALAQLGAKGIVFVPESAAPAKVEKIRRLGAEVRFFGAEGGATEVHARAYAAQCGLPYISPYNDLDIVAGQATIGVELAREAPGLDAVFASLGGGGLVSGVGGYLKALRPQTHVVAVSARNSKAMMESVAAGSVIETEHLPTLSDGTAGGVEPGAVTFDLCRTVVDEFVDVTEDEIRAAMRLFVDERHEAIEGAAGVAIAGLLASKRRFAGKTVAVVICGENIGADVLKAAL